MSFSAFSLTHYPRHWLLWRRYRHLTMSGKSRYIANMALAGYHIRGGDLASGSVVECGTWAGGSAFGLIETCRTVREFHFFDSFQGLPTATPEDGRKAIDLQSTGRLAHDNNTADYATFVADLERVRRAGERVLVHRGWFEETLPKAEIRAPIAILRLDGDWYQSTLTCLRALWDRVMPGGLVIVDDYYDWEGCAKALHEFLAERQAPERIRQTRSGKVAYLLKELRDR